MSKEQVGALSVQISYLSTSPDLSRKDKFPFFMRTVPPDIHTALAITELLK